MKKTRITRIIILVNYDKYKRSTGFAPGIITKRCEKLVNTGNMGRNLYYCK